LELKFEILEGGDEDEAMSMLRLKTLSEFRSVCTREKFAIHID